MNKLIFIILFSTVVVSAEIFLPDESDLSNVPPFYSNIVKKEEEGQRRADENLVSFLERSFLEEELLQKKISLKMKPCKIEEALEFVGRLANIDFLIDHDVSGRIGKFNVDNKSLGFVLKLLCENNLPKLALIKQLGVWRVMLFKNAVKLLNEQNSAKIFYKVFKINNAKFNKDLEAKVKKIWDCLVKGGDQSYIIFDRENKKIFAKAEESKLKELEFFISEIDCAIPQVKIEVIIVSANKAFEYSLGINWSGIYNRQSAIQAENKKFAFTGLGGRLNDFKNYPTEVDPNNFALNLITKCKNFFSSGINIVKLPFVFGGSDLNTRRLNLLLEAAEAEAKMKIVSRPSVLVSNNEKAEFLIGRSLPLQTIVEDVVEGKLRNVQTINYKDVGTKLHVTPVINKEKEMITLDILVEDSEVSEGSTETNAKGILTNPPVVSAIRTRNRVSLKNGQTTVIGGLLYNKNERRKKGLPFLPIVGWLFQGKSKCRYDSEQLIFITPTIIKDN